MTEQREPTGYGDVAGVAFEDLTTDDFGDLLRIECAALVESLMAKRDSYGSRNLTDDGSYGIAIRAGDKVARLKHMAKTGRDQSGDGESANDAWSDLMGYAVLGLIYTKMTRQNGEHAVKVRKARAAAEELRLIHPDPARQPTTAVCNEPIRSGNWCALDRVGNGQLVARNLRTGDTVRSSHYVALGDFAEGTTGEFVPVALSRSMQATVTTGATQGKHTLHRIDLIAAIRSRYRNADQIISACDWLGQTTAVSASEYLEAVRDGRLTPFFPCRTRGQRGGACGIYTPIRQKGGIPMPPWSSRVAVAWRCLVNDARYLVIVLLDPFAPVWRQFVSDWRRAIRRTFGGDR